MATIGFSLSLAFGLGPGALLMAAPAVAGQVQTTQFDLPASNLAIFGVQYTADFLGPPEGTILQTRAELTYTAGGSLDAADIVLTFQAPSEGVPIWQFSGADLGWSGTGTFHASVETDTLNGVIDLGDPPPDFSLFFLAISAVDFQPLPGQFTGSFFQVDVAPPGFTPGDVDSNGVVDVDDLTAVIVGWGSCPAPPEPCPADLDGSGAVDVDDLTQVILNWT